jgi:hypothetical protein
VAALLLLQAAKPFRLLLLEEFLLLPAGLFLLETEPFLVQTAHLFGVVNAVEVRFVGIERIGHGVQSPMRRVRVEPG